MIESFSINQEGHLQIGGVDTVELAEEYGTPLYVLDERKIRYACKEYNRAFNKYCGGKGLAYYASKALNCKEILRIVKEEGLGLDVVSGGELYTALSVDFPTERINFHGNNKSIDELTMALDSKIGGIIVDNFYELDMLNDLAGTRNERANVILRITPGIDAHTHSFIKTGEIDSKFGFILENGEALNAVKRTLECENFKLIGLHCHIGSQIFDIQPFIFALDVMLKFMAKIYKETGYAIKSLNLGGGFGIRYLDSDKPLEYDMYIKEISEKVEGHAKEFGVPVPHISLEPGRSIVGDAGITLYTVGNIKQIPGIRTFVCVDGGMFENPRYALYQAEHKAVIANRANEQADFKATIAGKCCESGDLIGENMMIQKPKNGDVLAVFSTGAYNYSMASRYNRNPVPAMVLINNGKSRVIIKRETYEDLLRNDI